MERFIRIKQLLGNPRFTSLQKKSITVVGLGAVGGYAVEGLARAGIQNFTLVDFDTIQPSNINRQILALETTMGRPKVAVAKERILAINPSCKVKALQLFASDESMAEILQPKPDLLIDAIDSLNPKAQLLKAAHKANIPMLSSMGAALRTDPSKIAIADLFATRNCPLARRLRKRLRRQGIEGGITCVFSTEPVDFEYQAPGSDDTTNAPYSNRGRSRRILGSLPTLTGIFGLYLANQAILQLAREEAVPPPTNTETLQR